MSHGARPSLAAENFTRRRYSVELSPLAEKVGELLGVADLADLPPAQTAATLETDQKTRFHAMFYARVDEFLPLYHSLVRQLVGPDLDTVYVQRIPTFRVHLRHSLAVGTWHRDRDFGHDPRELNYWVPLTPAYGTNSVWIEGREVVAEYGEAVVFDGANLEHGNKINDTAHSRVSIDFRTLPRAVYEPRSARSVSYGSQFILGDYWDRLDGQP